MTTKDSLVVDSDGVECPSCDRADFDSVTGMKIHHKTIHGESISGFVKTCANCGQEFEASQRSRIYCSTSCFGKANAQGEDNPAWDGGKETVTCKQCGSGYEVTTARVDSSSFCSKHCQAEWRSENTAAEDNPAWKGGWDGYYGKNWPEQRRKVLERDGYQCRACGISDEDHRAKNEAGLHIHHITPFREFDDPNEANSLDNLVAACESCHMRFEGLPVFPV